MLNLKEIVEIMEKHGVEKRKIYWAMNQMKWLSYPGHELEVLERALINLNVPKHVVRKIIEEIKQGSSRPPAFKIVFRRK